MNHTSVKKKQSNNTEQNNKENSMTTTATVPTASKPAESNQEQKVNTNPQAVTAPQKSQEKPQNTAVKREEKKGQQQATMAPAASQKPQEVKEDTLNLSQVAALTGRSYAGVNASAEKLAAAGANTSGKGKEWKVTRSHLVQVGWLDEQGNAVAPQRGRTAAKPSTAESSNAPAVLSIPELVLVAELAEQQASEKKQVATEALAAARAARRAVEEAVQNAEAEFKQAEANLAAARSIMEKK